MHRARKLNDDALDRLPKKRARGAEEQKEDRADKKRGVNATSFLALKADLAKSKAVVEAEGEGSSKKVPAEKALPLHLRTLPSTLPTRNSKKSRKAKSNASVGTSSWASTPSANLDAVRANLERKAKLYDALKAGKEAGVSEEAYREGLIDWERKAEEESESSQEESEDEEERGNEKEGLDEREDEVILYEDEFGRSRPMLRSQVPREWLRQKEREEKERAEGTGSSELLYGPSTSFPVYRPPSPVLAAKRSNDAPARFDHTHEVRNRGAGFYAFSRDESARAAQLSALEAEHRETEAKRVETSAEKALDRKEERRREVERKRRELEEKRKSKAAAT